ncbi:MAG TPA: type II toxin-antitoxin system HicB family antitoxin [Candidatus Tyrphobacter sp.]
MRRYEHIAERTSTGYSAYIPALPGCVSTGRNSEDLEHRLREAVAVHLELSLDEPITLHRRERRSA